MRWYYELKLGMIDWAYDITTRMVDRLWAVRTKTHKAWRKVVQ